MPILSSLAFRTDPRHVAINIAQSSRLRSLSLDGDFDLAAVTEPLCLLDEIKLDLAGLDGSGAIHTVHTVLELLNNLPCLKTFTLILGSDISEPLTYFPRLVLPAPIIESVTLLSLEALHYASGGREEILFGFFRRSKPLTFLPVQGCHTSEDEMIGVLQLLPGLKEFRFSDALVPGRFFRELTVQLQKSEDGPLSIELAVCLELETLCLDALEPLDHVGDCAEALARMLESRARIQKSFERIYLDCYTIIDVKHVGNYVEALENCLAPWT